MLVNGFTPLKYLVDRLASLEETISLVEGLQAQGLILPLGIGPGTEDR